MGSNFEFGLSRLNMNDEEYRARQQQIQGAKSDAKTHRNIEGQGRRAYRAAVRSNRPMDAAQILDGLTKSGYNPNAAPRQAGELEREILARADRNRQALTGKNPAQGQSQNSFFGQMDQEGLQKQRELTMAGEFGQGAKDKMLRADASAAADTRRTGASALVNQMLGAIDKEQPFDQEAMIKKAEALGGTRESFLGAVQARDQANQQRNANEAGLAISKREALSAAASKRYAGIQAKLDGSSRVAMANAESDIQSGQLESMLEKNYGLAQRNDAGVARAQARKAAMPGEEATAFDAATQRQIQSDSRVMDARAEADAGKANIDRMSSARERATQNNLLSLLEDVGESSLTRAFGGPQTNKGTTDNDSALLYPRGAPQLDGDRSTAATTALLSRLDDQRAPEEGLTAKLESQIERSMQTRRDNQDFKKGIGFGEYNLGNLSEAMDAAGETQVPGVMNAVNNFKTAPASAKKKLKEIDNRLSNSVYGLYEQLVSRGRKK